jgi:hypothetical protein
METSRQAFAARFSGRPANNACQPVLEKRRLLALMSVNPSGQ